jgi:hypothetical protein
MLTPDEAGFCRFDFRPAPGVLISPVLISSTAMHDEVPMIVTDMPVESLVPYARNPRNNTAAIDAVKASIAEFGFRQPIVVDEKLVVIVGHTRLEAAKALGLKMVPVHVAEGLTPAQAHQKRPGAPAPDPQDCGADQLAQVVYPSVMVVP